MSIGAAFTDPSTSPFPLSNYTLIAPFWDDINTNVAGRIFFRFSGDPDLLDEVGSSIEDAFDCEFNPVLLFIATWDSVAQINGSSNEVSRDSYG